MVRPVTYPHFPKARPGARVVGYTPLTGQPKHEDGTLKIALIYEQATYVSPGVMAGKSGDMIVVDEPAKPRRSIVRGTSQGSLL